MTREEREEAIQVIKNFPVESTKERKAVLTAIKALEWDPCEDEYGNYRYPSDVELTEPNMATSMPCNDTVSRQAVLDYIYNDLGLGDEENGKDVERQMELESSYRYVKSLPPVTPQPKMGHCKDCKWWKDSDGLYRRGSHAESRCPVNRREVFEGNGYCYVFEPQESEG